MNKLKAVITLIVNTLGVSGYWDGHIVGSTREVVTIEGLGKDIIEEFLPAIHERMRQIEKELFLPEFDDSYNSSVLSYAAAAYAMPDDNFDTRTGSTICRIDLWPFNSRFFKRTPDNRLREIDKAMALLAAERGRLVRAQNKGV